MEAKHVVVWLRLGVGFELENDLNDGSMFQTVIDDVLQLFEHAGLFAYLILFLVAFLERASFTGIVLPGGYIVILIGFLTAHGYLHAPPALSVIIVGATTGDCVGYMLGRKFGKSYFRHHEHFLFVSRSQIELVREYFRKQGGKTILTGRFVSVLYMVIPFASGMSDMEFRRFLFFDSAGNIGWAFLFMGIGYFIGRTALMKGGWIIALSLFFLVILAMIVVSYYLNKTYKSDG